MLFECYTFNIIFQFIIMDYDLGSHLFGFKPDGISSSFNRFPCKFCSWSSCRIEHLLSNIYFCNFLDWLLHFYLSYFFKQGRFVLDIINKQIRLLSVQMHKRRIPSFCIKCFRNFLCNVHCKCQIENKKFLIVKVPRIISWFIYILLLIACWT